MIDGLRWVKRPKPAAWNADPSGTTGPVSTTETVWVLQASHVRFVGSREEYSEWRDVPYVNTDRESAGTVDATTKA
jgi:hypothetical protein